MKDWGKREMRRMLEGDEETEAVKAVLYTSKMAVGVSVDTKIHRVLTDLSGSRGCTGRESSQMLLRFREVCARA